MVEEYLQKLYQEFYAEKLNLEQEKQRKEIQLYNNIKFVKVLEESLDEDFESFSPRKVDEESHKKISSLVEEQKVLKEEILHLQQQMDVITTKMEEADSILENVRQNQGYIDVPSETDEKLLKVDNFDAQDVKLLNDILDGNMVQDIESMIHKIEMCSKLLEVDSIRCKLELREIEQTAKKIMKVLQKLK